MHSQKEDIRKMMFKSYLYGYLNTYYVTLSLTGISPSLYRKEKYVQAASYLNFTGKTKKFFLAFCSLLAYVENLLYILSVTITLFKVLLNKAMHHNDNHINPERDTIVYGYGAWNLTTLINKAGLNVDDMVFLTYPCRDNKVYQQYKHINVATDLSLNEILMSYCYSLRMICYIKKKYGHRDVLFHSNNAMEYFLIYSFYIKHHNYNICFVDLYDRWAYMYGSLENFKILIQHGFISSKSHFIKKIGSVDFAYVFNESQKKVLLNLLIGRIGDCKTLPIMQFSANDKLIVNGKKNLLIICSHYYYEKEKEIVYSLRQASYNIYVKPHPLDDQTPYKELVSQYKAVMLGKSDFPKVDIAISYASTLALEYQMAGVQVLQYDDPDFETGLKNLIND